MTMIVPGVVNEGSSWDDRDEGPFRASGDPDDYAYYEKAWRGLYAATALWNLLGSPNGIRLTRLIKEEIERPENKNEEGAYVISPEQIARIVALLDGLDAAIEAVADPGSGAVRPERADDVRKHLAPDLWEEWRKQDGAPVYSVAQTLSETQRLYDFLRGALLLGRPLTYG